MLREAAKCNQANLKLEAKFTDLGFDSLDQVELVIYFLVKQILMIGGGHGRTIKF